MDIPTPLRITIDRPADGQVCLHIQGEVDLATAPHLSDAFAGVLDEQPERIELDCSELTFLDSSGIQVLVAAWDQMKDRAPMPVVLTNVSPLVHQVLVACGIDKLLIE